MTKKSKEDYKIQSVAHALDILEEFQGDVDELGVTELSNRLKLHKNNVFRLLATLDCRGYVEQNRLTEKYRLGLKSLELGQTFLRQMGLLRQARPVLKEIVDTCNETAYVSVIRDGFVVYLDAVESNQTVRVVSKVGHRLPVYCSAVGKAQIAFDSQEDAERYLPKEMVRYTSNTITDKRKFLDHLREVQQRGYAVDNEEYDPGVKCVGVPIRDYTRRVVGALSVSGPAYRLTSTRVEKEIGPLLAKSGHELSLKLGHEVAG
ncbi:MAG: IclR family transcriptional regulator [Thermodesulfobacteriota bacterium]